MIRKLKDSANLIAVARVSAWVSLCYVVEVDRLILLVGIACLVHHGVEVPSRAELVVLRLLGTGTDDSHGEDFSLLSFQFLSQSAETT